MKKLTAAFCLLVCISCLNQSKLQPLSDKEVALKRLISKLKILPYPISYTSTNENHFIENLVEFDDNSTDTLIHKDFGAAHDIWGLLPDTSENYKIVAFYLADYSPMGIVTFDKKGNLLNDAFPYVGNVGVDVCCRYSETTIIKSLNYILCTDTAIEMKYDTVLMKCIDSTKKVAILNTYFSLTREGKLNKK